jgi:hypothetical protein
MKREKLTEKAEEYESNYPIMDDLIDEGYSKRDIISGLNYCAEMNSFDEGDDIILFIQGILWERRRQNKLKRENKK